MSAVLPYDLNALFAGDAGAGKATLIRDYGQTDAYGGEGKPDWQQLSVVDCVMVWNRSSGVRSSQRVYVTPARTVPMSEGFMVVPANTDVTQNDRVTQILFNDGTLIDGLFIIDGVIQLESHIEVYFDRSHLGA